MLPLELHWVEQEQSDFGREHMDDRHDRQISIRRPAIVNGIELPPCFIEEGIRINTRCYIRMLDDVYLPHCVARLGTDTSSWWWRNPAPHVASMLARPEPARFSTVARVGNGAGRAQVRVPARTAHHDRAHHVDLD